MGAGDSSTRKVSFAVDEEERVRILRGVKLTEDVLLRMKGVANQVPAPKAQAPPTPQKDPGPPLPPLPPPPPPPSPPPPVQPQVQPQAQPQVQPQVQPQIQPQVQPQVQPQPITQPTGPDPIEEMKKSIEWQTSVLQEELSKMARRETEAARLEMTRALHKERLSAHQERDRANILVQKLQKKDAELTALDAFYKEQLTLLETRNRERYAQAGEQFHHAADHAETHVRSRNTEAVCSGLQAQILACYRDNREQTLLCSDLAKAYMQCISAAKKNLLVNHG